jgi:hypothetical protein
VRPPTAPATEPLPPGTPENLQPPAEPVIYIAPSAPVIRTKNPLLSRAAISSVVTAGLVAVVGTILLLALVASGSSAPGPFAFLCMFAAGGLSVTLYRSRSGGGQISLRMGAKLGAFSGLAGYAPLVLICVVMLNNATAVAELHKATTEMIERVIASAPEAQKQAMQQLLSYVATDHGLFIFLLSNILLTGALFVAFSALGGMLGAMLFGREGQRRL